MSKKSIIARQQKHEQRDAFGASHGAQGGGGFRRYDEAVRRAAESLRRGTRIVGGQGEGREVG